MEAKYSEDYAHLLNYQKNPDAEVLSEETDFFYKKYHELVSYFCKLFIRFGKTTVLNHSYTDKIDFEERLDFLRDQTFIQAEKKYFKQQIIVYIERAIENFKPDKVQDKEKYSFAYYLKLWLKTGLRDIRAQYKQYQLKEIPHINNIENENTVIEKLDFELLQQRLAKVFLLLSPLDRQICAELSSGKQQNEIKLKNPKTDNFFSTGYICKRIQVIRKIMEENGLDNF